MTANNISAAQIRDEYLRRQQAAEQDAPGAVAGNAVDLTQDDEADGLAQESVSQKKKRKRQEEKAIAKIKQSKGFKRRKNGNDDNEDEDEIAFDMYSKSRPLPGQLENCEICNKRFTVTAYSKTGPGGGLLCPKCSKELEAENKKDKPKKQGATEKRRQTQSKLLDGFVSKGATSLIELCIKNVADNINDVEEFGDLPPVLLDRLSQILSKRRALNSRTLDLFLRPDLDTVALYDSANIKTDDYKKIFAIVPNVRHLLLVHAGQFKDEVIQYMLERNVPITNLELEAANLVSNDMWRQFFKGRGKALKSLKLTWLDFYLDDDCIDELAESCTDLRRLKLERCFKLGPAAFDSLTKFRKLEHLSLRFNKPVEAERLVKLISTLGSNLRTLSLQRFDNANDDVLCAIHSHCHQLTKFRLTDNELCTDAGFVDLFTDWSNPPLSFIDLSSNRDLDYNNPDGPERPNGLASSGFEAVMRHSGSRVEKLDISSCRHISHATLLEAFDGVKTYPELTELNINFLTRIDTPIVAGIFKSCPKLKKVVAFGCFNVNEVSVPAHIALIGLPNAQNPILINGDAIGEL
ncbi:MAG: hypothetical protein M1819_002781 [Sarea resinae]|nr:MAG: hypothetical protein M1819_002781 [Sarea resinae]